MNTSSKKESGKEPATKREKWRHAFAIGKEYEERVTEEDEKVLEAFARSIVKRRLSAPALLWFTSLKPLNFLGASIMQAGEFVFKSMMLESIIKYRFMPEFEHGTFVKALEKRVCVDRLIDLIDKYEAETQAEKKAERKERKRKKAKQDKNLDDKAITEKEI